MKNKETLKKLAVLFQSQRDPWTNALLTLADSETAAKRTAYFQKRNVTTEEAAKRFGYGANLPSMLAGVEWITTAHCVSGFAYELGRFIAGFQTGATLKTASPVQETEVKDAETIIRVLQDKLRKVPNVIAGYIHDLGDVEHWLLLLIAPSARSAERIRENVADLMWDVSTDLPDTDIDFVVYTKEEARWPSNEAKLQESYERVL